MLDVLLQRDRGRGCGAVARARGVDALLERLAEHRGGLRRGDGLVRLLGRLLRDDRVLVDVRVADLQDDEEVVALGRVQRAPARRDVLVLGELEPLEVRRHLGDLDGLALLHVPDGHARERWHVADLQVRRNDNTHRRSERRRVCDMRDVLGREVLVLGDLEPLHVRGRLVDVERLAAFQAVDWQRVAARRLQDLGVLRDDDTQRGEERDGRGAGVELGALGDDVLLRADLEPLEVGGGGSGDDGVALAERSDDLPVVVGRLVHLGVLRDGDTHRRDERLGLGRRLAEERGGERDPHLVAELQPSEISRDGDGVVLVALPGDLHDVPALVRDVADLDGLRELDGDGRRHRDGLGEDLLHLRGLHGDEALLRDDEPLEVGGRPERLQLIPELERADDVLGVVRVLDDVGVGDELDDERLREHRHGRERQPLLAVDGRDVVAVRDLEPLEVGRDRDRLHDVAAAQGADGASLERRRVPDDAVAAQVDRHRGEQGRHRVAHARGDCRDELVRAHHEPRVVGRRADRLQLVARLQAGHGLAAEVGNLADGDG